MRPAPREAVRFVPMRPAILNPLFAEARTLAGVGPKIEKHIAKALGTDTRPPRVLDLALHLPFSLIDRNYRPKLNAAEPGRIATEIGRAHV